MAAECLTRSDERLGGLLWLRVGALLACSKGSTVLSKSRTRCIDVCLPPLLSPAIFRLFPPSFLPTYVLFI